MGLRGTVHRATFAARAAVLLLAERMETGVVFNPIKKSYRADPYPLYRDLQRIDPFHRSRLADGWVLSRYEDILSVLNDRAFSADERNWSRYPQMRKMGEREGLPDPYETERASMLRMDPPDHTRLRSLVSKAFTPRAVEAMRGRIESVVEEVLDRLPVSAGSGGTLELVGDFAAPLPITVIAEMLGVPAADHGRFRHWSDEAVKTLGDSSWEERRAGLRAMEELGEYIAGVADERRAHPRDDLISGLVAAEEEGDRLSREELFTTCVLLLVAGNETTTKLIGNSIIALLRNPAQLDLLRSEPKRILGAVDELLRYDSPVQLTSRFVTRRSTMHTNPLEPGQQVVLLLAAGNRDPEHFDEPDRLDVTRENVRHLSFGQGMHHCLGSRLARLEGALALEALITRFPDLRFEDGEAGLEWGSNTVLRGPCRLPLRV
jgi:pimeloyl-[acyl-carrier protein] synthase